MELEHPTATVLGKIDIAFGIRRDAMNLIEFTRKLPDPSKGRHHLAGLPIDDLYLRIVLVNVEDVFLVCVRRERERYHRAPVSLGLPSAGGVTGYGGRGAVSGGTMSCSVALFRPFDLLAGSRPALCRRFKRLA